MTGAKTQAEALRIHMQPENTANAAMNLYSLSVDEMHGFTETAAALGNARTDLR